MAKTALASSASGSKAAAVAAPSKSPKFDQQEACYRVNEQVASVTTVIRLQSLAGE